MPLSQSKKLIYTEKELPQRSQEWLTMRKKTIGASDTGVVLGLLSKYERPITAWKRRTGRLKPKTENAAMVRGREMEEEAKALVRSYLFYNEKYDNPQLTPYFALHSEHDFISASFDGVDIEHKFITELKCPKFYSQFKSVFEDGIQEYYYCQVQQQLLIANDRWGIEKAYYCSYYPEGAYILNHKTFKEDYKRLAVIDTEIDWNYCNAMLVVLEKFNDNVLINEWDEEEYQQILKEFKEKI